MSPNRVVPRKTGTGPDWSICPYVLEKPKGDLPKWNRCDYSVPPTSATSKEYRSHMLDYHPNKLGRAGRTTSATSGQPPSATDAASQRGSSVQSMRTSPPGESAAYLSVEQRGRRSTSAPGGGSRLPPFAAAASTRHIPGATGKRERSSSHSPKSPGAPIASAPSKRPRAEFSPPPGPWIAPTVTSATSREIGPALLTRGRPQSSPSPSRPSLPDSSAAAGSKSPAQTMTGGGHLLRSGAVTGVAGEGDRGRSARPAPTDPRAKGKMPVTRDASRLASTEVGGAGTSQSSDSKQGKVRTRNRTGQVKARTMGADASTTVVGRLRKHVDDREKGIVPKPYGLVGGIPWYIWTARIPQLLNTRDDETVDELLFNVLGNHTAGDIDSMFSSWRRGVKPRNKALHNIMLDLASRYEQAESSAKNISGTLKQLSLEDISPKFIQTDGGPGNHSLLWILHCLTGPEGVATAARKTYAAQMTIGPFPMDAMIKLSQIKPDDLIEYGKSNTAVYYWVNARFKGRFEKLKKDQNTTFMGSTLLTQIYDDCDVLASASRLGDVKRKEDLEVLRENLRAARSASPRRAQHGSPSARTASPRPGSSIAS